MSVDSIIHSLQGRGYRMTAVRRFLLETFETSRTPLSATEIMALLTKNNLECNRTTVYRELTFLHEQNVIKTVDFGDGARRYEQSAGDHHHHFICTKCKMVFDVNLTNDLESEERLIEKNYDVKVASHSLEFFGICKNCKE